MCTIKKERIADNQIAYKVVDVLSDGICQSISYFYRWHSGINIAREDWETYDSNDQKQFHCFERLEDAAAFYKFLIGEHYSRVTAIIKVILSGQCWRGVTSQFWREEGFENLPAVTGDVAIWDGKVIQTNYVETNSPCSVRDVQRMLKYGYPVGDFKAFIDYVGITEINSFTHKTSYASQYLDEIRKIMESKQDEKVVRIAD